MISNPLSVQRLVFVDWDDTWLGVLLVPQDKEWQQVLFANMGCKDLRGVVDWFARVNMVHPDLRDADPTSLERTDNYRGKYPHMGPRPEGETEGTVADGERYPLTNKLDYAFFKRKMVRDPEHPDRWVEVKRGTAPLAGITDPWAEEREEKWAQAVREWPRRRIYPEEAFVPVFGDEGLVLKHGLRYLPHEYIKRHSCRETFRPAPEQIKKEALGDGGGT